MQVADTHNYVTVDGTIHHNSGKSFGCAAKIMRLALAQKASPADNIRYTRWCVVRNTFGMLKTTTMKTWTELFPEHQWGRINHTPPMTHHIRMPARGKIAGVDCEVLFLALDQPKDVRKLLSLNITGFWANEARELPFSVITHLIRRVGRYPAMRDGGPTWRGGFMDTNPMDEDHWWHRMAEKERPKGKYAWNFYKQPPAVYEIEKEEPGAVFAKGRWWKFNDEAENLGNLPEGYYEQQISSSNLDEIRCYIAGQYVYVQEGKPVWPEYDDDQMSGSPEYVKGIAIQVGLDFGLTPAAVIGQKDPRTNQWRILAELPMFDMGLERFGLALNSLLQLKFPGAEVVAWGDPAGQARDAIYEVTAFDYLRTNCGIMARPTATNDPKTRREAGAAPMERRNGLVVHHECRFLRRALAGGYHFKRVQVSGKEYYRDVANKNQFSHVGDAFGYLMLGGGEYKALVRNVSPSGSKFKPVSKVQDFDVWTV
jgi:hypothetical protein